jgi:energy-coupling factor transporter ATP-binding protein EcfA2
MTAVRRRGLERVALDLHVHTPASHDWDDRSIGPDDFVAEVLARGIQGIAITDHTTAAWADELRLPAEKQGLLVFPAVELGNLAGNEGIHLAAIFDIDFTSTDIDRFLTTIGSLSGKGGRVSRGPAIAGPMQVLDEIAKFGGIAVLAHCATKNGALGGMRGELRTKIVQHPALLAAEAPPEDYHNERKRTAKKRTWDLLDGSDPVYQRELAVYSASDNPSGKGQGHGIHGIGQRFAYFWMERPFSLETLRQCLVDRSARIEVPAPGTSVIGRQQRTAPTIARLHVTGGFLGGLDVELHDGLNTILGAKGSGKSLLVELLRFALDQEPTQPEIRKDHEAKLQKKLGLYGRVGVDVRQPDGSTVAVEREFNPAAGNPWRSKIRPIDVISCHFLSQGEIVRMAESEEEQIRFIDSFFDFRSHQGALADTGRRLGELDRQVATQIAASTERDQLRDEQTRLKAEIVEKDKSLRSRAFGRYQRAQAKSRVIDAASATGEEVVGALDEANQAVGSIALPDLDTNLRRDALSRRVAALAEKSRTEAMAAITVAMRRASDRVSQIETEKAAWALELDEAANAHSLQVQAAGGDQRALSQARSRIENELNRIDGKLRSATQIAKQLQPTVERRNALLGELHEQQRAYTLARQDRCRWFQEKSNGQIKASVSPAADRSLFRDRLTSMKRGSHLTAAEIDAISSGTSPDSLVDALLKFHESGSDHYLNALATATKLARARIIALSTFLLDQAKTDGFESLLELQHAVPALDRPEIQFRREDGSFAPLAELSTGQKSTALLVMALAEGDKPIVVDQPEDSLDIRSIWEDMCVRLRLAKRDRQFAFTTHNSTMAVASDTDAFLVLAGGPDRGEVVLAGAIDHEEVRNEVIRLLEGGPSTYFLKQRKYNIADPYTGALR